MHLPVQRSASCGSSNVLWSRLGMISTTASLPSLASDSFSNLHRPFEVERIEVARDHVELALELRAERRPVRSRTSRMS